MFDIGFSEIVVCVVVALIVIGPEQLPETVRSVSLWIGRLKRSLRATREEFERQVGMDDIRRQLHNEDVMKSIEDARKEINATIDDQKNTIHEISHDLQKVYTSEPELPYHSHMDDPDHGKSPAEISTQSATTSTTQLISESTTQSDSNDEPPKTK